MWKRIAWGIVKPVVRAWLAGRALVLPASRRTELAQRLNMPVEKVQAMERELQGWALEQLEAFRP
jgi:hypothetical protein